MEHKKTVRNADGSSEVTVTRSKGDQSHTVVIKKDNTGTEEKIENFKNIDKGIIITCKCSVDFRMWMSHKVDMMVIENRSLDVPCTTTCAYHH